MVTVRTAVTALAVAMLTGCAGAAPVASPPRATASAAPTSAVADLDALRARGSVRVAIRMETPPVPGKTLGDPAHSQKRAFEAKVAELVVQRAVGPSVKVELRNQSAADLVGPVDRGEVDLAMAHGMSTSTTVAYSKPFAAGGVVLAVPAASTAATLADLRGKRIVVAENQLRETAERYIKAQASDATVLSAQGYGPAADMVASGGADAVIGDATAAAVHQQQKPGALRIVSTLEPRPYAIGIRRSAVQLVAAVESALVALLASGEIEKAAVAAGFPWERPR